jgi:hypothetical protein
VDRGADVEGFVNSRDITIANKKSSEYEPSLESISFPEG